MSIYLDDQVMNGTNAVLKYLGVDKSLIPTTRRKLFEVKGGKTDRDGNLRICKSIYGVAQYTIHVPILGRQVKVRIASNQTPNKDKGFLYSPKNIGLEPSEDGSVLVQDEEQFLFWFLRPMNKQSPFRSEFEKVYYEYMDNEDKAKTSIALEEARINAMSIIVGDNRWSVTKLKSLAKGLEVQNVDDMSTVILQEALKKIAYADPIAFYSNATSRDIIFSGKIQDAIDKDILTVKTMNGMKRWYLSDREILPLQHSEDPNIALKNFLAQNWHLYADEIQAGIDGKSQSTFLNSPENDAFFQEEEKHITPETLSHVDGQIVYDLKQMDIKDEEFEKIKKIAEYDLSDPNLHHSKRKSYEMNKEAVDAYKESLKAESAAPVAE